VTKAVFSLLGWFLCAILFSKDRLYESLKNRDIPPFDEMNAAAETSPDPLANAESQAAAKKSDGLFFVTDLVNRIRQPAGNKNSENQSQPTLQTS
jgi:hypothetical protein